LPAAFIDQLRASNTFANLIVTIADGLSFSYDARAERILGEIVAPDYFTALGVPALLGQTFTPEVRNGHWAAEAVLSYNFWQRRLGGDPAVIGRTIHLNTYPFTIVGVSAPSFSGIVRGTDYELRIPMLPPGRELAQMEQASGSPKRWLDVMARLKPGSNIAQAESAADAQLQQFLRTTPLERFSKAGLRRMHLSPAPRGYDEYVLPFRDPLYILLVLVGIVLLIACSNVASMLLARATARSREFAIRTSIGAGRFRLIRQMLAESLLLAIAGGVLGVAIANWGANIVFHFLPQGHIAFAIDLHPDVHILFLTLAVSLLVGIGVGLAPAVQAARQNLAATMKAESAASVGAGRGARLRKLLVMSQVAFSLVLLIAAGAFVRTLTALRPADYRSNPSRILLFTLKPQVELYNDERKFHLAAELIRRVSALPGVRLAALAENGPLGSRDSDGRFQAPGGAPIRAGYDVVSRGFFDTVGIPRLAGRDFNITDYAQSPQVAIVNWSFAHELFPDQNPIGRTISLLTGKQDGKYEIIGVVADTHYFKVH
jgi:predicted permease